MGESMSEEEERDGRTVFEFSKEDVVSCSARDGEGWRDTDPTEVEQTCSAVSASQFDRLLLGRWEQAMRDGVFRYDLREVVSRRIPGQYGIVVLNNPKRFSHRRPPADTQALVQPFDPSQFNFNRVKEKEVLFEVSRKARGQDAEEVILGESSARFLKPVPLCVPVSLCELVGGPSMAAADSLHTQSGRPRCWVKLGRPVHMSSAVACGKLLHSQQTCLVIIGERHMIAVNVSPIDRGHVLLVPEPSSCLPQVMTESSLQLCLELVSLSRHSGFCMVANSLLAYASVNHLHYHFIYTAHPLLPARTVGGREVRGCSGCFELTGHYVRGFGFQMNSNPRTCARAIFEVVSLLLESGIPHNIAMLRGPPFSDLPPSPSLVRAILIPRKPVLGFKKLYQQAPPPFFAASCELALGLIPVMDREKYASITEEEIVTRLQEQELTKEQFSALVDKLCSKKTKS